MKTYKEHYDKMKKAHSIRQLTPRYVKWESEGQVIIGAYVAHAPVMGRLGGKTYNQYIFDTDEGLVKFALGTASDNELSASFERGMIYAITFQGQDEIAGGRKVNKFQVEELGVSEAFEEELKFEEDDSEKVDKK